jgi:hypothetical protein
MERISRQDSRAAVDALIGVFVMEVLPSSSRSCPSIEAARYDWSAAKNVGDVASAKSAVNSVLGKSCQPMRSEGESTDGDFAAVVFRQEKVEALAGFRLVLIDVNSEVGACSRE